MKKIYKAPTVEVFKINPRNRILDSSNFGIDNDAGIVYEGGGSEDPRVRENTWNEAWEGE